MVTLIHGVPMKGLLLIRRLTTRKQKRPLVRFGCDNSKIRGWQKSRVQLCDGLFVSSSFGQASWHKGKEAIDGFIQFLQDCVFQSITGLVTQDEVDIAAVSLAGSSVRQC